MFDINKYRIQDTADYHVTDAKGNELFVNAAGNEVEEGADGALPVTITVLSPGTKVAAKAKFALDKARQSRVLLEMGGKRNQRTEDDDLKERADFLAKIASQLNNWSYPGGAAALYRDAALGHIADGVEKFFNDRGNFSADLSATLSNTSASLPG